jgi:hypothetical protein
MANSFKIKAKDDPKDRIDVIVGDDKQVDFYPQVKIERWDNECNFSVRLSEDLAGATLTEDKQAKKIIWEKAKIQCQFFGVDPCVEHPEGAYKFEYVLKEKPVSNKLKFTIETKGLDFFYQPKLTKEEIDEGAFRPENVVGSYAVYHNGNPTNWVGGKEYKAGKAFHIFRPKLIDTNGDWVWADLNIDVKVGIYAITIPQDFLDKAVYPIKSNDTFGYATKGTTGWTASWGDIVGSIFPGAAGTGISISAVIYEATTSATAKMKYGIYKSDLSFLANSTTAEKVGKVNDTTSTVVLNFVSAPTFTAVNYWLVGWFYAPAGGGTWMIPYDTGSANTGGIQAVTYAANFPASWSPTTNTRKHTIYATYTPAVTYIPKVIII